MLNNRLPHRRHRPLNNRLPSSRQPNLALRGLERPGRSSCTLSRPRPQPTSSHYGLAQFQKWLRWIETHS